MRGNILLALYQQLLDCYGPQHWWPASAEGGPFEVMVGAILTQNTAWVNVERAIANLRAAHALSPIALRRLSAPEIGRLIYSSGYYNAKATKLKALAEHLAGYEDDLERFFSRETADLRRELLSLHGIGDETADSIILYAAGKPIFVVDAYTRRILRRLGLGPVGESYADYRAYFMDNLPADAPLFNEYHGLLVRHGKEVCRKIPRCAECCLKTACPFAEGRETPRYRVPLPSTG